MLDIEGEGIRPVSLQAIREGAVILLETGGIRKMTVLVVDDDRDIRSSVKHIVTSHFEATVVMGLDARDGLREFKESRPDLVITDLEMENSLAGLALAREIKTLTQGAKVILMSDNLPSNIDEIDYIDCALPKPFKLRDLVSAIEQLGF